MRKLNRLTSLLICHSIAMLLLAIAPNVTLAQEGAPLASANTALANGDYDAAVAAFSTAANDSTLKCDALYGLGVAQLRARRYAEADAAFAQQLAECPPTFRGQVQRAQALQQLGRNDEALAAYQQAQALNPVLDSYLYERMATLNPDQSVYYLRLAAEGPRHPEGRFALREKLAQIYLLVGSPASALASYETLLREIDEYLAALSQVEGAEYDTNAHARARIELAAADIQIQAGQIDAGYARLQRIITNYRESSSALPALIDLVNAAQSVDLLNRTRINVLNENFGPVVGVLSGYLADPTNAANAPAELHVLFGRAQRGEGDAAGALATFARVRQQYPNDPMAATAALEQANTYLQAGDYAQAVAAFTEVAAAYPQSPEAPVALRRAATTERRFGDINRAIDILNLLSAQYPASEEARDELLAAGLALRATDPTRAAELLARSGTAEGLVWQGKLLAQAGNPDAARQAWAQAAAIPGESGTFFQIRACELINGRSPFEVLPIAQFDTSGDRAAAEAWVAQTFGLTGVTAELSPELANDPMLQRGTELWAVGLWSEARAELDALHKLHRDDPVALLQLAYYYDSVPIYRSSLLAATRLIYHSEQPLLDIPDAVLRLAFPMRFSDLILPRSQERGLDPLLVAALIRQESSFDPTVNSIVGARGLMQFMPATAQDMATQLAWPSYTIDDLYRPIVSVAFGTHYLSSMRAFQGGSDAGALLSYNAGPGAAQVWINRAGSDLETLYETIEYPETKSYLDIIYANHFIYQQIYTDGTPDC